MKANGQTLHEIPSLDELVSNPGKATLLSSAEARACLISLVTLQPLLIAQALGSVLPVELVTAPDRMLSAEEAAARFGVTVRWLYRHKRHLPYSQPSRKVLLFPASKLERWFAAQKTT